jgi:8-oxo-dGTP pyrophosphatase MutT (NUDIX family)
LFGGRADWGETPLACAKRELLEESGLVSDDWELLFEINIGGKIDWPCLYYVARNCRKVADQNLDAGEKIELLRVPMSQFMNEIIENPAFRDRALRNHFYSALNEPVKTEFMQKLMK